MSIRDELADEIVSYERMGLRNYSANYLLSIAAVLASFFAGLSVALDWFGRDILAVLSAIPAAVLIASERCEQAPIRDRHRFRTTMAGNYAGVKVRPNPALNADALDTASRHFGRRLATR